VTNILKKTLLSLAGLALVAGCVVEMHPADSTPPAASATPAPVAAGSVSPPAAEAAQPVKVVSGRSGINPPIRNQQPAAIPTATDTSTVTSTDTSTSTGTSTATATTGTAGMSALK